MTLKERLKEKLTKEELAKAVRAYDLIGEIAIVEVPRELGKKEKLIAKTLLESHNNIKTVLKKGKHTGTFRTQKLKWLAGKRNRITECRENNVWIRMDVEKCYFSPRMSTERKRIMQQVKDRESVLVMFSGTGVYPTVIAKNTKAKEVYGVEINPEAHKFALENLKINKLENVKLFLGDVRTVVPKLKKKFDRVLMPLPKGAEDYLDVAVKAAKKNGTIHFYDFLREGEFEKAVEKIDKSCKRLRKKYEILKITKCGQLAARQYRVCVDFKVR